MKRGGGLRPESDAPASIPAAFDRRRFIAVGASTLVLGASAVALASCTPGSAEHSPKPTATLPPNAVLTPHPNARYTIDDLMSTTPFYIAHRGSGDNWPEHTMDAYSHSVGLGAKAIEVSVNATKDGVLVCHHDTTMARTSGENVAIADLTWSELSKLKIDARAWLGPASHPQPIPRLKDVLKAYAKSHVIFVEDKQGTNTAALLKLMDGYPDSNTRFVWKQWAAAGQYAVARQHGYKTWGYFTPELIPHASTYAGRFDYLGLMHTSTDAEIAEVVALGKPVIVWEVHYRSMRDRLQKLGVVGMMCSNLPYVANLVSPAHTDAFATGLRAPGDLPWTVDQGWGVQPAIDQGAGDIRIAHSGIQSYLMGSMAPIAQSSHTITARLRWPETLPQATEHAGIAFGQEDDQPYRVSIAGEVGGYHAILRATGALELYSRAAGVAAGTKLASVATAAPKSGEWIDLSVRVTPDSIVVTRAGSSNWTAGSSDSRYRGGYFWLCKNYDAPIPVDFSGVAVQ
jgi:Glycerophosphoryl diester phosphodiesterase